MTDDLVARLRSYDGAVWETTACYNGLREEAADVLEQERGDARTLRGFIATYKMTPSMMASRAESAEARVRELEAERDKWDRRVAYDELKAREHVNRATQQRQIDALTVRAETAERALAEAYERAALEEE